MQITDAQRARLAPYLIRLRSDHHAHTMDLYLLEKSNSELAVGGKDAQLYQKQGGSHEHAYLAEPATKFATLGPSAVATG